MTRPAQPHRPGHANQPPNRVIGDPPPAEVYEIRRGGRAVPDRTREPRIGPACYDTDTAAPAPRVDPATNAGPEIGTRGNSAVQKTSSEYIDAAREARGVRTRPVRPGQHGV
jgi:hypothetical protein